MCFFRWNHLPPPSYIFCFFTAANTRSVASNTSCLQHQKQTTQIRGISPIGGSFPIYFFQVNVVKIKVVKTLPRSAGAGNRLPVFGRCQTILSAGNIGTYVPVPVSVPVKVNRLFGCWCWFWFDQTCTLGAGAVLGLVLSTGT